MEEEPLSQAEGGVGLSGEQGGEGLPAEAGYGRKRGLLSRAWRRVEDAPAGLWPEFEGPLFPLRSFGSTFKEWGAVEVEQWFIPNCFLQRQHVGRSKAWV